MNYRDLDRGQPTPKSTKKKKKKATEKKQDDAGPTLTAEERSLTDRTETPEDDRQNPGAAADDEANFENFEGPLEAAGEDTDHLQDEIQVLRDEIRAEIEQQKRETMRAEKLRLREELAALRARRQHTTERSRSPPSSQARIRQQTREREPGLGLVGEILHDFEQEQQHQQRRRRHDSQDSVASMNFGADSLGKAHSIAETNVHVCSAADKKSAGMSGSKLHKSGMLKRCGDVVPKPQTWAHTVLEDEFVNKETEFCELEFDLIVAGELEIALDEATGRAERTFRLKLLKQLAYLHSVHGIEVIKDVYGAVLRKLELNKLTWDDDPMHIIMWNITKQCSLSLRQINSNPSPYVSVNKKVKTKAKTKVTYWCKDFQSGDCSNSQSVHNVLYQGKTVSAEHICAVCWRKEKTKQNHGDQSSNCPYREA